jgi:subtilisin family serine protease
VGVRSSILIALLLILYPISAYPWAQPTARYAPGEILVKFKEGLSKEHTERIHRSRGFKVAGRLKRVPIERINLPAGWSIEEAISFYRADPAVEYAEPNYIRRAFKTPNDPYFTELWGLHNTGQTGGTQDADIDAPEAWYIQTDCSSVVIAVLDTGVDLDHEDLKESIWRNTGEDWSNGSPGNNGLDDDGNGMIDDYCGWDFVNCDNDPADDNSTEDDYHGTHVTGIIAARGNNGVGITGICWSASIMILKILDEDGNGSVAHELGAIGYAIDKGAKIINLSLGGPDDSNIEHDVIKMAGDAGILFVASAGNEGTDNDESPVYPASYDLDNIISVTATDHNDELLPWANYGLVSVDVGAPGVEIYSTKPGVSYQYISGSSMAAPHVAGLAALIWAYHGELPYNQVKGIIFNGVDPKSSLEGKMLTGGRINAERSLLNNTLAAPANLYATAISANHIDLSWNDISYEESGFEIERRKGPTGSYTPIATINADTETFSDTGLQEPSVYYYRARAFKDGIESGYSREAHAPPAPSNLTAKWVYPSQIDLTWQDNSSHENGFKIERKTSSRGTYAEIARVDSDVTCYSDTGLSKGLLYLYRVRAYHSCGISLYSNEAMGTTYFAGGDNNHGCFIDTAVYSSQNHP